MRGKAHRFHSSFCGIRITPAYAGKSHSDYHGGSQRQDHPRLCGEKISFRLTLYKRSGSPPPMRGKVITFFLLSVKIRITPAYAGKSRNFRLSSASQRDHPRLCGEKTRPHTPWQRMLGSPPPMRGKVADKIAHIIRQGITPAYAGKSQSANDVCSHLKDHPRLCGEKVLASTVMACDRGSPPPMRGKVVNVIGVVLVTRITPAYAGKSTKKCCCCCVSEDHPRLCGEKFIFRIFCTRLLGSPPPMRGKALSDLPLKHYEGITPAYAGKRCQTYSLNARCWDHPRLCGEKA